MTSTDRLHTAPNNPVAQAVLVSVGYEGKSASDLITALVEQRVQVLIDVRLMPLSRKPGLSKTRLSEALAAAGIRYLHYRELGNPKDNRDGFRAADPRSRARYREVLASAAAADALSHIGELLDSSVVALLCVERDHTACHREQIVSRLLAGRSTATVVHI